MCLPLELWMKCSAINSSMITTANSRLGVLQQPWATIVEVDADGIICHVGNTSSGTSATFREVDLTGSYIIPVSACMQCLHGHRVPSTCSSMRLTTVTGSYGLSLYACCVCVCWTAGSILTTPSCLAPMRPLTHRSAPDSQALHWTRAACQTLLPGLA